MFGHIQLEQCRADERAARQIEWMLSLGARTPPRFGRLFGRGQALKVVSLQGQLQHRGDRLDRRAIYVGEGRAQSFMPRDDRVEAALEAPPIQRTAQTDG